MNKFNKLYEDIFKPASPEEVEERKIQGTTEHLKDYLKYLKIKYVEDEKGNIIKIYNVDERYKFGIYINSTLLFFLCINSSDTYNTNYMVKILLDNQANPNTINHHSQTPLHGAVFNRNISLFKLLLQHGADPYIRDQFNESVFDYCNRRNLYSYLEAIKNSKINYK